MTPHLTGRLLFISLWLTENSGEFSRHAEQRNGMFSGMNVPETYCSSALPSSLTSSIGPLPSKATLGHF